MTGRRVDPAGAARLAILVALLLFFLGPLLVALSASFKPPADLSNSLSLPRQFYGANYVSGWHRIARSMLSSLIITVPSVMLSVFIGALAAFPLSRMRVVGMRPIYTLILIAMLVPFQIVQIPLFFIVKDLGLYDRVEALWLLHMIYGIPTCTFFMRNYFATVPESLYEAAQMDGCGPGTYFFRILLPASVSGIAALTIVQSRGIWNDLILALTLINDPEKRPVPVELYGLVSGLQPQYGLLMASTFIAVVPVLLVFVCFQGAFTRGLLGGSAK